MNPHYLCNDMRYAKLLLGSVRRGALTDIQTGALDQIDETLTKWQRAAERDLRVYTDYQIADPDAELPTAPEKP